MLTITTTTHAAVMGLNDEMLRLEQRRVDAERANEQVQVSKQLQRVFTRFHFDEDMKRELHKLIPSTRHTIRTTFAAWISTQSNKSYDAKSTATTSSSSASGGDESSADLTSRLFWVKAGPGVGNYTSLHAFHRHICCL